MPHKPALLLLFVLTILSQIVTSQTNWSENFSDSNFTASPTWVGDTALFSINAIKELQLDAPAVSATAYLATQSQSGLEAAWEFKLRIAFNPSTSNYAKVFLMSNSQNLGGALQGYYLRLGGGTDDRIGLYKQNGTTSSLITQSDAGLLGQSSIDVRIRVNRDSNFSWSINADTTGGNNFALAATATDSTYKTSAWFGWQCIYTSTRSKAFFLDDISVNGKMFTDTQRPKIIAAAIEEPYDIRLTFSEPVDSAKAARPGNFRLTKTNTNPQTVLWQPTAANQVLLSFVSPFLERTDYDLRCEGVEDLFGNELSDTTLTLGYYKVGYRGVVISEIMADPSPAVGLPEAEYIELHNNGAYEAILIDWKFVAGTDTFSLPDYTMPATSSVLLVATNNAPLFTGFPTITIPTSTSYLSNSGEYLALLNDKGEIIDALTYSVDWHSNAAKREGGWSLEISDQLLYCYDETNWSSSNSVSGGTPGTWNLPEIRFKERDSEISSLVWQDDFTVQLVFNQGLDKINKPNITATQAIQNITYNLQQPNIATIEFSQKIGTQPVSIYVESRQSCSGNYVADTLTFTAPETPQYGDVVLNEILFNPAGEVQDFVEIWNTSQKTILLGDLLLANLDESGNPLNQFTIGAENTMLLPGQFLVVSADVASLCKKYVCPKLRFFSEKATPSMPDAGAHIALVRPTLEVLESVNFTDDWHNALISNTEMVSLERINPNLNGSLKSSWHSASTQSGYATPGQMNSQFLSSEAQNSRFWLSTETVSPNNDGFNDVVTINYDLPQGSLLTLRVFSLNGLEQNVLADNELTQPEGTLVWDGTTNTGNLAATGIYIIFATWFTPDGQTGNAKLNIAVSR
jgi:hypothetical protein